MEVTRPVLARCDDRSVAATTGQCGEPRDWLLSALATQPLSLVDFDFFVEWGRSPAFVPPVVWIKRLVVGLTGVMPPDADLLGALAVAEPADGRVRLGRLCERYGIQVQFALLPEPMPSPGASEVVVLVDVLPTGEFGATRHVSLPDLRDLIQGLSGGPVGVGAKGLIYGTSELECRLSHTDYAWPGDVDGVLVRDDGGVAALLEFKKDNLNHNVDDATSLAYYPARDGRKYDRLAIMANRLEAPLVAVLYGTQATADHVKIERLRPVAGAVEVLASQVLAAPTNAGLCEALLAAVQGMI